MRAQQAEVQLGDEDVDVVARIADQRRALRVARDVAVAGEQLGGIGGVVEERRADGAGAVEAALDWRNRRVDRPIGRQAVVADRGARAGTGQAAYRRE